MGYCLCGSFCTFAQSIHQMEALAAQGADITPILSGAAYDTDTRFGKAADIRARIESICGKPILHTIVEVEPIGPAAPFDILLIAPCTGNTLSKLAAGITDTPVTMAAKAHLRSSRPLCLALATNDALMGSAAALGKIKLKEIPKQNKAIYFTNVLNVKAYRRLPKWPQFCLGDKEGSNAIHYRLMQYWLETWFPNKSRFEK